MALQQPQQPQLQMSWQPSLLSQKRKTGPPLGFRNLGNSCYLNSVLQCLTYTPPLANFCLRSLHTSRCDSIVDAQRKRDCPFCIVEKRIARSLQKDLVQDAPSKLQSCLSLFAEHFRIGRQEDAHEFLRYVIDACHNTCLCLKKLRQQQRKGSELLGNGGNTIVKEIFGGALQSQVKCLPCGAESNKIDEIMDISLDIMSSSSLKDAMHKFFQPEVLDGNNKYKCENCKKLVPARKQMSVFQAPNILVIQLKRFGGGIFGRKIDKMISFQEVLVLSGFMCKASQDPLPEYNLFGTIVHAGCSPDSGHYYAYIKDPIGRWYRCNDAFVSPATLEEVLSEKVYVLFFSRSKQRPQSVKKSAVNGVKPRDFSGSETSKSEASSPPPKLAMKPHVQESSCKVMPAPSKIDKVPFGHRMKFPVAVNGSKTAPSSSNGKVDPHKNVLIETTEDRDHGHIDNREKHVSTSSNGNCSDKENESSLSVSKKNEVVATESNYGKINGFEASGTKKSHAFVSENGNGHIGNGGGLSSVKLVPGESNGAVSIETNGKGSEPAKLQNGSNNVQTDALQAKRKLQDGCCRLLGQSAPSKADVEEIKKWLEREAKSKLRSSAWPNEVEAFMRSKKRSRVGKLGNTSEEFELSKQKMIEDAKGADPSFLSQVPPPLMQGFINHLRIFFEEKR